MPLGIPAVAGTIDRRILLNYRVAADAMAAVLPEPFEPLTVDGYAVGGICLIRLRDLRPRGLPAAVGVGSENAAHRVAVEWEREDSTAAGSAREDSTAADGAREDSTAADGVREDSTAASGAREEGSLAEGVYVPRRDTSSWLFAASGGRLFSDHHSLATFDVTEGDGRYAVTVESRDGNARVHVAGERADALPDGSVFDDLAEASAFFERGSVGVSSTGDREDYYAVELQTDQWAVEPLAVETAESSYFGDAERFPPDSVELDHALLMEDVDHEWHERQPLCTGGQ